MTKYIITLATVFLALGCAPTIDDSTDDENLPDSGFAETTDDESGESTGGDESEESSGGEDVPATSGPDDMTTHHMSASGGTEPPPVDCLELEQECHDDVEPFDMDECLDSERHADTCHDELACNVERWAGIRKDTAFCVAQTAESCMSTALRVACEGRCDEEWLECMHEKEEYELCLNCEFTAAVCRSDCW